MVCIWFGYYRLKLNKMACNTNSLHARIKIPTHLCFTYASVDQPDS